jgi:hypothetical protein
MNVVGWEKISENVKRISCHEHEDIRIFDNTQTSSIVASLENSIFDGRRGGGNYIKLPDLFNAVFQTGLEPAGSKHTPR